MPSATTQSGRLILGSRAGSVTTTVAPVCADGADLERPDGDPAESRPRDSSAPPGRPAMGARHSRRGAGTRCDRRSWRGCCTRRRRRRSSSHSRASATSSCSTSRRITRGSSASSERSCASSRSRSVFNGSKASQDAAVRNSGQANMREGSFRPRKIVMRSRKFEVVGRDSVARCFDLAGSGRHRAMNPRRTWRRRARDITKTAL